MRLLSVIILSAIAALPSCVGGACEEPPNFGLYNLMFTVVQSKTITVFTDPQARASLEVMDMKTGKPVNFSLSCRVFDRDTIYDGRFILDNPDTDFSARDSTTCSTYVVKYRTDDVDTLKVCYKLKFNGRCETTEFTSVFVAWNGKSVSEYPVQFEYVLPID